MKPAPPVIKYLAIVSSDGIILKAELSNICRVVKVAAVKDDRRFEQLFDPHEVGPAEFVPFGQNQQCRSAGKRLVVVLGVSDSLAENLLGLARSLGIKSLDIGTS